MSKESIDGGVRGIAHPFPLMYIWRVCAACI